ncbi:MAG TPA: DUF4198 domain-containing protein [Albitalea sp.]|uniref:DUF4198 domain-containing protein n=1 Tax=Piscinibacter sp. TaxID=1903157 RepID=UPI002ED03860
MRHCLAPIALVIGLLAARTAGAHDTWFQPEAGGATRDIVMALGTGNRYPVQEFPLAIEQLRQNGCRAGAAPAVSLSKAADTAHALIVRAAPQVEAGQAVTCWAQLAPMDIELPPDKVRVYLREINASPATLAAWADMRQRGVAWKERYTKHARIEFAGSAAPARPVDMGMDIVLESGLQAIAAGDPLVFQVLRDGAPLADFPVELCSERQRLGVWRRTDGEGRIRIPAPPAGRWVLRGTDLRLSEGDTWESRFVTLAFSVK